MEHGKLCRMGKGPSGPYYNHQRWENGRNVVRYVPRGQIPALQEALDGYQRFRILARAYADQIIRQTRKTARPDPRSKPSPAQK